ncbi:SIR2 family protein [Micromonospora sp. NBRC 101691]|uniref:SIR2 family protein n=1 Tax=Micromonospora sp. NBRC 101691 TaxID=3032198 RepID=UPI0025567226|nr:SIR2 family protein [Micromonospora sp. NBRC 101691]
MPISEHELLSQYGSAVRAGNASLFVGAGLSKSAGYPDWSGLVMDLRQRADIPDDLADLPLVAQYFIVSTPGGREALESHVLAEMTKRTYAPTAGHRALARLPVDDLWTTNYDCLLEEALPDARVICNEDDLLVRHKPTRRRLTKMHGSLTQGPGIDWRASPTITRQDYEEYEFKHPRIWAALRASYLTKSFLFLGFSFMDPNIEVMLRLSRTLLNVGAPEHYTLIKRPDGDLNQLKLHEHRVKDLEQSGVAVCEISEYSEIDSILARLVRRTREPALFVSGSVETNTDGERAAQSIGHRLSEHDVQVVSLGGKAGLAVSFALGRSLLAQERYDPERVKFYFRRSKQEAPGLPQRIGTAVYTGQDQAAVRAAVLSESRAVLVLGGGDTTEAETTAAKNAGIPVIPLPLSGGTARKLWSASAIDDLLGMTNPTESDRRDWQLLNHEDLEIATAAAVRLMSTAMYLDSSVRP